jgi:hypothetical protein
MPSQIFVRPTGETNIVETRLDGSLRYWYATTPDAGPVISWHWTQVADPGFAVSTPSIFVRPTGEADIVAQGPDGILLYFYAVPHGQWTGTQVVPPGDTFAAVSAPSIVVRSTGEADIVALGQNNSLLYHWAWPGGPWSHAQVSQSEGETSSPPSIFVRPTGEADIVAAGPDGSLWYYHAMPGDCWWSRTQVDGPELRGPVSAVSAPSIFVRPTGEADIVAQGQDNSLWYYHATPGGPWDPFQVAGPGTTASAPSIFVSSTRQANIAAQGQNGTLMYYSATPDSPWTPTQVPGPGATSPPSIFVDPNSGRVAIVTNGPGASLLYYYLDPNATTWALDTVHPEQQI